MKSVWNIQEIKLSVGMKTSIDSYFRARSDLQRQYASVGLMNHIKTVSYTHLTLPTTERV